MVFQYQFVGDGRRIRARINVDEHARASRSAVARPKLGAVVYVPRVEEKDVVDDFQALRTRARGARESIGDELRARARSVRAPKLNAEFRRLRREIDLVAEGVNSDGEDEFNPEESVVLMSFTRYGACAASGRETASRREPKVSLRMAGSWPRV